MNRKFGIASLTFLLTAISMLSIVHAQSTTQEPALSQHVSTQASLSNWSLKNNQISLDFNGKDNIDSSYESSYSVSSQLGILNMRSSVSNHRIVTTLTDPHGNVVYSTTSPLTQDDKSYHVTIPLSALTPNGSSGFQLQISDRDDTPGSAQTHRRTPLADSPHTTSPSLPGTHDGGGRGVVISTANTVPEYAVFGLGLFIIGGAAYFMRKKKGD